MKPARLIPGMIEWIGNRAGTTRGARLAIRASQATLFVVLTPLFSHAQQPIAELPRVYIDSSYHAPGGSAIFLRSGGDLQSALDEARPGDTVVLQAGSTFSGNFVLPPKSGEGWIYIQSSAVRSMPGAGIRTSPAEAHLMAKLQTPNSGPAISVLPEARNYRLVGLEITPASGARTVHELVNLNTSRGEAALRSIVARVAPGLLASERLPNNIVIDRCYIHGSDTQEVREGVVANGTAVAILDSYISDIHDSTRDSQAIIAYRTPGPIKIINNFLSATTEEVMFGGAGGPENSYIPSDIEIRHNHFFKPLAWKAPGITLPPRPKWIVKNNLEFKSGSRVLVSGNVFENNWLSGQVGYSIVLTVRTSESGNAAVVDDLTIENNLLTNVDAGFSSIEVDDTCKPPAFPLCSNAGQSRRWKINNNLVLMNPEKDGAHHNGFSVATDMADLVFQHNTLLMSDGSGCWNSFYFNTQPNWRWPPPHSYTHNVWVLDNVLCLPPTGDYQRQGTAGLSYYMGDPVPLEERFSGNVLLVPPGESVSVFPPRNLLRTTAFGFANPAGMNYQVLSPPWMETSDGLPAGVDMTALQKTIKGAADGIMTGK